MEDARKKIVVIDDDPAVLAVLQAKLVSRYVTVCSAKPIEAIALVRAEQPDVVLCDIDMPRMNGGEVAAALAADSATFRIPFIYLTSLVSPAEAEDLGGSVGGRPAVSKRATMIDLVRVIDSVTRDSTDGCP